MNEKIQIIIASILKPVNDPRAFEKFGRSLVQTNKYAVNIIGFDSKKKADTPNISYIPIFHSFRNNYIKRIIAPFKYLKYCIKLKPQLIIVNTPELLLVTYMYKIIFGTKIIYDIQENYRKNIETDKTYLSWQKPFLNLFLTFNEGLSRYFVDHFFVAEKIFPKQLNFIANKPFSIIENKSILKQNPHSYTSTHNDINNSVFIISGTIGPSYGTLEGIIYFKSLQKHYKSIKLIIIGYCAIGSYLDKINQLCEGKQGITLKIKEYPVPQALIIEQLKSADFALLPYHVNENLKYRIPTKLYDLIQLRKPIIINFNPYWDEMIHDFKAGISVNFNQEPKLKDIQKLQDSRNFTFKNSEKAEWNSEEYKLLEVVNRLT